LYYHRQPVDQVWYNYQTFYNPFIICVHFVIIYVHFAIIRFHLVIIYVHFAIFRVVGIIFRVFRVRDIIFAY
ncbi:hypothetical protein GLOIN_2v1503217, partial [Rhizophagus irregularis DAOM 181602=DAOM 197198]